MDQESNMSFEQFTAGVERNPDGTPVLVTRWGYTIVEIGGKKYLAAASPEETRKAVTEKFGRDAGPAYCLGGNTGCIRGSCTHSCQPTHLGGGNWVCLCQ